MDWLSAAVGFVAGIAAEWMRRFGAGWFDRREIRNAVGGELNDVALHLNFLLYAALEDQKPEAELMRRYYRNPPRLVAVDLYWEKHPDRLMRLPEWKRLQWVNDQLAALRDEGELPRLYRAIGILQAMTLDPLQRSVRRETRKFIQEQVLSRASVQDYLKQFYQKRQE